MERQGTAWRVSVRFGSAWLGVDRRVPEPKAWLGPTQTKGKSVNNLIAQAEDTNLKMRLVLTGIAPLMLHAPTLIDPLHPLTREMQTLTGKGSKRTIADHERIARLEWEAGLYHDDKTGPFVASVNVKAAIKKAAGLHKLGAKVGRGVVFEATKIPIEYDGPRDRDGLWDAGYRDTRPVKNGGMNGGRVMRTRPCFDDWALDATIYLDPHEIGVEDFARCVVGAQRQGVGDYRPEFGLFTAELYEVES